MPIAILLGQTMQYLSMEPHKLGATFHHEGNLHMNGMQPKNHQKIDPRPIAPMNSTWDMHH